MHHGARCAISASKRPGAAVPRGSAARPPSSGSREKDRARNAWERQAASSTVGPSSSDSDSLDELATSWGMSSPSSSSDMVDVRLSSPAAPTATQTESSSDFTSLPERRSKKESFPHKTRGEKRKGDCERARASVKRERRGLHQLDERTGFHRCGHPGWSADAGLVPMPPTYRPLLVSRRLAAAYTRAAPCSTRERPFSPAERVDLAPPHGARSDRCARNSHTATPTQIRITNGNCPAPRKACAACTAWMQSPCLQQDASNEHVYGPC